MELPFEEYMAWLAAHIKERDQGVLSIEKDSLTKKVKGRTGAPATRPANSKWTTSPVAWTEREWVRLPKVAYGAGVYVIYADAQPVYIGMSDKVDVRVRSHMASRGERLARALGRAVASWTVKYRPERFAGERATLELRLIRRLKPTLNRNSNGRKRGDSELPAVNCNQYRYVRKEA